KLHGSIDPKEAEPPVMRDTAPELYPLVLSLHRLKKAWGGLGGKVGEVWSLAGPPHESLVLNGPLAGRRLTEIVGQYQQKLLGKDVELDPREPFPMLLKFLSTSENTGIQVHPRDAYTMEKGLPMVGVDKLWYVLNAKSGSRIYLGFREKVDGQKIRKAIVGRSLYPLLNEVPVRPGDLYTIPAGRVHAMGKGVLLFEVRHHSELNFKLIDRAGSPGETAPGETSLSDALEVLDCSPTHPKPVRKATVLSEENRIVSLSITPRFSLRRLVVKNSLEIAFNGNRMVVYTGIKGSGSLKWGLSDITVNIQPYQSVLVPAIGEDLYFQSDEGLEIMETTLTDMAGETVNDLIRGGVSKDRIIGLGGEDYGEILKAYVVP
ncbi:MAG: type I phosphomannose isomerase catalytic subunit, partial [Pseudomonadota bacterium]